MNGFVEVDWTDHEFTNWICNKDPEWTYMKCGVGIVHFYASEKIHIAFALYDNAKCTRRIFVREELIDEN